jgi:hypothetical protein
MTWTYTPAWLSLASGATTSMTQVRLLIGDTMTSDQQLQDEEIYFVLSFQPTQNYAAADCADLISAKYARQINTENSLLRVSAAARHKHYEDLAKRLRKNGPGVVPGGENAGAILGEVYAGGTSHLANEVLIDNPDNVVSDVAKGLDDYPENAEDAEDYFI